MTAVNWTNITDLAQLPSEANNVSGGMFWSSMLYMLWIILMLITVSYGFEIAILSSSFLALVLAILLVYAGLIGLVS